MDQSLVGDGSGKWLLLGIIQRLSLSLSLNELGPGPAVLAALPAAVLGQEARPAKLYRGGCCQDFSVIQWAHRASLDACDPHPHWLEAGEAGRRRLWF